MFKLLEHSSNEFQSRVLSMEIVLDIQFFFQLLLSSEIESSQVEDLKNLDFHDFNGIPYVNYIGNPIFT